MSTNKRDDDAAGARRADEETPLLDGALHENVAQSAQHDDEGRQEIDFGKHDLDDPRQWSYAKKMANVGVIALMAVLSPLASSMFTPGISQMAEELNTSVSAVVGATTGFVVLLGLGPLILAPLSETFGRRALYLWSFSIFSLLQIPTALSPNVAFLVACRTLTGFFGSVGIANGGGTISDMFIPSQRAGIFGWYLLGPLLGPTLGPLFGGIIVEHLGWRWVFWILTIVCMINTLAGFIFLRETYAPVLLQRRCDRYSKEYGGAYTYPGHDERPLRTKVTQSMKRPLRILFTQPIVLTMATYQAVIFTCVYSLFTNMEAMYGGEPYNFDNQQIGLCYLAPGIGFLSAVWFIVPRIDSIYNKIANEKNDGVGKPEYRLPLANLGAVLLPVSLVWFGWTVQRTHWIVSLIATFFFGVGQITIFNTVQNYYIDAFEKYAASAIAAGAVFRSFVGGIVPLFAPSLFKDLGYGWGWSVFAFVAVALSPSPLLFMRYGERIRAKYAIDLE